MRRRRANPAQACDDAAARQPGGFRVGVCVADFAASARFFPLARAAGEVRAELPLSLRWPEPADAGGGGELFLKGEDDAAPLGGSHFDQHWGELGFSELGSL